MKARPALLAVLAAVLAAIATGGGASDATFTSSSRSAASTVSSGDWTPPAVTLTDPGSPIAGTVTLAASAADTLSGVARIAFAAAPSGSGSWATLCTVTAVPATCGLDTTTLADGSYDLRAVAVDGAGNQAAAVVAGRLVDNQPPTVTLADPGGTVRGTVTLTASATDAGSGLATVAIQRSPAGTGAWVDVCSGVTAPLACPLDTTTLADDSYDLRAVATDRAGRSAASAVAADVLVDNTAPTVILADPGSPLRGTVTLSPAPADAGSGVAAVTVQRAPAGSTAWVTACTATASPWSCRFDTTGTADGSYDLRAVATDAAGNATASATVRNRTIDNTVASVSMEDPGAYLRGTVPLTASASSPAGVVSVRIQRTPTGTAGWTDVCTVTAAPYACAWNSATVGDGLYDFRAVLLDGAGKTTTSAAVTGRRVDNTPVRGADVQAANRTGGTTGRIEAGDTVTFTYSAVMNPATILAGWSGASQTVAVRIRDGGLLGGGATDDTLDVFAAPSLATPVRLGTLNLHGDFVKGGKTAVFNATVTLGTATVNGNPASTVTVTVGTLASGGGVRTSGSLAAMVWTPSASATDTAGNACSTAPVSEQGTLDKDF